MEKWHVKKASPGLDTEGLITRLLGEEFTVEEFDSSVPLEQQVSRAHVLLVRTVPVTRQVIDAAPRLRLIHRPGQYVGDVDISYAAQKGIPVCNVPGDLTEGGIAVAEHVMFLILALAKRYNESRENLAHGRLGAPLTYALKRKTLGLIGVGRTGTPLIKMAKGFDMRVWAVKRTADQAINDNLGLDWLQTLDYIPELLAASDFVSIHAPLTRETMGMIGRREIGLMKPTAFLINIARGALVDKAALFDALETGRIAGAGFDVFWDEPPNPADAIFRLSNVIATPHMSSLTVESRYALAEIVVEEIKRVKSGLRPLHVVNTGAIA